MKNCETLARISFDKSVDRLSVSAGGWVTVTERHPNGSDETLGEITLRNFGEVLDLQFLLDRLVREAEETVLGKRD